MDDMTFDHRPLPSTAQARKRATWKALEAAISFQVQERRVRRARAAALVALAAIIGIATTTRVAPRTAPQPRSAEVFAPIEFVDAPQHRVLVEVVDDDELLDELAAMGLRRGIIRGPHSVMVVSR